MKNPQQTLLILLSMGLCGLCAFQWNAQTRQREQLDSLSQEVFKRSVAIRDYTNSIAAMTHQIAQMDERITGLKTEAASNAGIARDQKRELERLAANDAGLTNQIREYKRALDTLEDKLKMAYEGIEKQNAALKEIVAQRDEFVAKYNDSVKDRNDVVSKYNELVARVEKLQNPTGKP